MGPAAEPVAEALGSLICLDQGGAVSGQDGARPLQVLCKGSQLQDQRTKETKNQGDQGLGGLG